MVGLSSWRPGPENGTDGPGRPPPHQARTGLEPEAEVNAATSEVGARPYRIYDGDGALVGDFAAWLPAHRWAHQRAAEPGTRLPVEIEDRSRLYLEQVWTDHCQTLHAAEPAIILTCPLAAVGEPALRVLPGDLCDDAQGNADGNPPRGLLDGRARQGGAGGASVRSRRSRR